MQQATNISDDRAGLLVVDEVARHITSPRLAALLWHWHKARGDRQMPGWRDLDPAEMVPALPLIWVWGYDRKTNRFTGRLAGEEVRSIVGRPIVNVPMEEYFERWNYAEIFARHKRVVDEPAIAVEKGQVFRCNDRVGFGERVILPLARDGLQADMTIAATTYRLGPEAGETASGISAGQRFIYRLGGTETQFFPL